MRRQPAPMIELPLWVRLLNDDLKRQREEPENYPTEHYCHDSVDVQVNGFRSYCWRRRGHSGPHIVCHWTESKPGEPRYKVVATLEVEE